MEHECKQVQQQLRLAQSCTDRRWINRKLFRRHAQSKYRGQGCFALWTILHMCAGEPLKRRTEESIVNGQIADELPLRCAVTR